MRRAARFFPLLFLPLFFACFDGENYCNGPQSVDGFLPLAASYDPAQPVRVELDFIFNYNQEIHERTTLFAFSVPDVFVNPKGDGRPWDVVDEPAYTYTLKDPNNAPASIVIQGYAFNDCGESLVASATINFR